jgi:NOL1/NOP2/fmu family ribosome biogenesis protein
MVTAWEKNGNQLFANLQREILTEAVKMLKPGGKLLYSTCTFAPLENEKSIEYLLSLDDSLSIEEFPKYELFDNGHPEWSDTGNPELIKCARLWPHRLQGEGHFVTLIKKAGENSPEFNTGDYPIRRSKIPDEAREFIEGIGTVKDGKRYISNGRYLLDMNRFEISQDKLYYIPQSFPSVRGLRILRCGLYMGELKKKRFEPSQALAMLLAGDDFENTVELTASDERVERYLKGETIDVDDLEGCHNGLALICVDGFPLGWGKKNGGTLKNKYLSGWRLM